MEVYQMIVAIRQKSAEELLVSYYTRIHCIDGPSKEIINVVYMVKRQLKLWLKHIREFVVPISRVLSSIFKSNEWLLLANYGQRLSRIVEKV